MRVFVVTAAPWLALHCSDKIFSSLDNDESDAIDFREYLLGLAPLLKGSDQDILRCACLLAL